MSPQRVRFLGMLLALATITPAIAQLRPRDIDRLPTTKPTAVVNYGPGALQFGELRVPSGKGPFPVVVVIHGGCWTKGFATVQNTAPIASDLAANNVATWNIEYRQVGDQGGGWPGTFLDWAAATDFLRVLARTHPLDLSRVVVIGHSAGGHAALWVAARHRLPATSLIRGKDPLPVRAAVSIDGPGNLSGFVGLDAQICGQPVVSGLMGGAPADQPDRYAQGSPFELLPLGVPQLLISAAVLQPTDADAYSQAAKAKGDVADVIKLNTGHFELIAPGNEAWETIKRRVLALVSKG